MLGENVRFSTLTLEFRYIEQSVKTLSGLYECIDHVDERERLAGDTGFLFCEELQISCFEVGERSSN